MIREVEPERRRKGYFQAYYYQHGRMEIRINPVAPGAVRWLGVPRHLLRALLTNAARWLTAIRPNRRFYYRLECALRVTPALEDHPGATRRESLAGAFKNRRLISFRVNLNQIRAPPIALHEPVEGRLFDSHLGYLRAMHLDHLFPNPRRTESHLLKATLFRPASFRKYG